MKRIMYWSVWLLLTIGQISEISSQELDRVAPDSVIWNTSILPVAFYLPETSLALGATGMLSFKKSSQSVDARPSQILFAGIFTLKNQIEFLSSYEIYADERKHRFKGEIGYYKYSYNFYGIGPESQASDLEKYNVNFPRVEFSYARHFLNILNLGLGFKMDYFTKMKRKPNGLLDTQRPIGWDGGLKTNLQLLCFVDTRDNLNAPLKGFYGELVLLKSLGWGLSDFDYSKLEADFRYFTKLGAGWTLGHQLWVTSSTAGTPFYDLPYISTSKRSRGFSDRRFLNPKLMSVQSELRFPIFNRLRGAAFYSYNILPSSWSKPFENQKYVGYGLGLRYVLRRESRTAIRMDVATGDESFNFYITLNEAF